MHGHIIPVNQDSTIFRSKVYKIKQFGKVLTNLCVWQIQQFNCLVGKLLWKRILYACSNIQNMSYVMLLKFLQVLRSTL